MLVVASLTDPIVQFAVDVVDKLGLPGIFALMVAESACIPIPSEATFLFAGFNVSEGHYSLAAVVAVGTAANLVGSWIAYAVGYYGRIDILEKHGAKLHIKPSHLQWADRWFERYGSATVFFTRMLPIIRTFISLPAGVARMPFWRFTILTTLGCIPWIFMLTFIGHAGRRELGVVEGRPALRRLRRHRDDPGRRALLLVRSWRRRSGAAAALSRACAETVALGLLQGPAELLPVSSTGARRAARPAAGGVARLGAAARKELGGGAARGQRGRAADVAARAGAAGPAGARHGAAGARRAALERPIEAGWHAGTMAAGLLAGSRALVAADRAPQARAAGEAGPADGLWLGLAQAAALVPGVSRSGAMLAAARARGFAPRGGGAAVAAEVALPVLAGATALKGCGWRDGGRRRAGSAAGARRRRPRSPRRSRGAGAIGDRAARRPLWPWAAWRAADGGRHPRRAPQSGGDEPATPTPRRRRHGRGRRGDRRARRRAAHDRHRARRRRPCAARATTRPCSRWRRTSASRSARTASARS